MILLERLTPNALQQVQLQQLQAEVFSKLLPGWNIYVGHEFPHIKSDECRAVLEHNASACHLPSVRSMSLSLMPLRPLG